MLPDFRLETYFSRWEFNAKYNICASDVETIPVQQLLEDASKEDRCLWEELRLAYTETYGSPVLRQAIADTYDCMDSSDIIAFTGAEEGIFAAMHTLLSADDHVIVLTPNYQSAETIPASICEVTGIALDPENNWELDIDLVQHAIRPNTKLISFNFPHNPTGKVLAKHKLGELIEIARKHGIYIFSDEVYRLLERDESIRLPQVADIYERALSLNVMSKAYGLPGLRIGWVACKDHDVLDAMERTKHYLSICNSGPSEVLSIIALHSQEKILRRNRKLVADNLGHLNAFFDNYPALFDWTPPDGGCIGYPRYRGEEGVEQFCKSLVQKSGVLLLPASVYRSALTETPKDHFRIGYGRANMVEGLNVMRDHIDQYCITGKG